MPKPRDSQRSKVYRAEWCWIDRAEKTPTVGWVRKALRTYDSAGYIRRVEQITASAWWEENCDGIDVAALDGRGSTRGRAFARRMAINIPGRLLIERVIIHELAHLAAAKIHGLDIPGHGWQFCSVYLEMVSRFIGADGAKALRQQFRDHRVKYLRPRPKRQLSEAQRRALLERLGGRRG